MDKYSDWAGLGFQMIAVIGLSTWGGIWLDKYLQNSFPVFTLSLSVLSVLLSLYQVIRKIPKE
jgi:hypothetical protein